MTLQLAELMWPSFLAEDLTRSMGLEEDMRLFEGIDQIRRPAEIRRLMTGISAMVEARLFDGSESLLQPAAKPKTMLSGATLYFSDLERDAQVAQSRGVSHRQCQALDSERGSQA